MSYLFEMRVAKEVRWVGAVVAPSALALLVGGCDHMERRYLTPDEESLYLLETPIELPIRVPTAAEQAALGDAPWVSRGDYETEVTFTVTNLDTESARLVGVTLNGISPLWEYVPGFTVDNDAVIPDFSQWERTYVLEPGESRTITVREEEIDEITVDLAAATSSTECEQIANHIVYFANQAGIEPRSTACIPPVVPGLVGLRLGLRSVGSEPPPIAIEASAEVRDVHDRIASPGQPVWMPPTPTQFTPPPPPEE